MTKSLHFDGTHFVYEEGEIVIWTDPEPLEKVKHMWLHGGQLAVPLPPEGLAFDAAVEMGRAAVEGGYFWCNTCKKRIYPGEAHSHFAGRYCDVCWDDYKIKNARKCRICGQPLYSCCC